MRCAQLARFLSIWALLCGCGDDSESLESLVDKLVRTHNETTGIWCECAQQYGWGNDLEACEDAAGYVLREHSECLHEAFATDEKASMEYLRCLIDEATAYQHCVDDELVCNPQTPPQGCIDQYVQASAACGPPPLKVGTALEACGNVRVGPPPLGNR